MADEVKRNFKAIASDVAEGFIAMNPIFLKPFDEKSLKALHQVIERMQIDIRTEPFPYNDVESIRKRNMKLQRLYSAQIVLKNHAREKRFSLEEEKKIKTRKKISYF